MWILASIALSYHNSLLVFRSLLRKRKKLRTPDSSWDRIVQLKIVISYMLSSPIYYDAVIYVKTLIRFVHYLLLLFIYYLLHPQTLNYDSKFRSSNYRGFFLIWGCTKMTSYNVIVQTRSKPCNELFHYLLSLLRWKGEINYEQCLKQFSMQVK